MHRHFRNLVQWVCCVVLVVGMAVLPAADARAATTPYVSYDGNLVLTSGGDLYNPSVPGSGGSMTGQIGSNTADSNTWGTGGTSTATGPDIGSTWRLAALTKVSGILNADASDALTVPADLNQPLLLSVTLGGTTAGSANSAGYAPRAYLYGIDTAPSGNAGWWGSADMVTKAVSNITPLTAGTWNGGAGTWTFNLSTPGLATSDTGDLLGIAVVGNENAVANESFSWLGSASSLTVTPGVPSPPTGIAFIDINSAQGTPPVPDANSNYWNAITGTGSTVNLVDTAGVATGWDVAISTVGSGGASGFSGVGLNNTVAAPSPYDVQEAYADGWYDNTPGKTNGQVSFSGLDSASSYHLTLWGNRSGWNDGTVSVTAGTPGVVSALQANTLLELDIVPDASNTISFTMDEVAGGGAGGSNMVLSLMSIEESGPAPPAPPAQIGVNFTGSTNNVYTVLGAADVAGAAPADNWNNINISSSRSFAPVALNDDAGAATGVIVESTVSAGWPANAGIGNSTPDHTLMNGVMNFSNEPGGLDQGTITVSNVNAFAALYDVYVYIEAGTNNNRDIEITVDGLTVRGQDRGGFAAPFLLADGTLGGSTDHDYILFSGLTADSFTIDATNPLANGRAGISGFQIVPVPQSDEIPEPATMCALALAMSGLVGYVRRRRKLA